MLIFSSFSSSVSVSSNEVGVVVVLVENTFKVFVFVRLTVCCVTSQLRSSRQSLDSRSFVRSRDVG